MGNIGIGGVLRCSHLRIIPQTGWGAVQLGLGKERICPWNHEASWVEQPQCFSPGPTYLPFFCSLSQSSMQGSRLGKTLLRNSPWGIPHSMNPPLRVLERVMGNSEPCNCMFQSLSTWRTKLDKRSCPQTGHSGEWGEIHLKRLPLAH